MKNDFNTDSKKAPPDDIVVFVDLDGVLADFDTHLHAHNKADDKGKPKWDELDHGWWESMPVFHGARKFYGELKKLGTVKFLSAPVPIVGSFSGKAAWIINAFLPQRGRFALNDLILCAGKDKQYLAGPARILVDDRIKNISEWQAAGGIGVHHKGDFNETLRAVQDAIAAIRGAKVTALPAQPEPQP